MANNNTNLPFPDNFEILSKLDEKIDGGMVVGLDVLEPPPDGFTQVVPIGGGRHTEDDLSEISLNSSPLGDYYGSRDNYNYNQDFGNYITNYIDQYEFVFPYIAGPGIKIDNPVITLDVDYVKSLFLQCP